MFARIYMISRIHIKCKQCVTNVSLWCQHMFLFETWTLQLKNSFERFRSLSSACVKGTSWLSSTGLYASSLAITVMSLNQNYIPCYPLTQEQEGLDHERLVLWLKEHRDIRHVAGSCDLFLLDLSCRIIIPLCDLFLPSRPLEWQMAYSLFYYSFNLSSYPHVLQQT